jgi:hypothetical protein
LTSVDGFTVGKLAAVEGVATGAVVGATDGESATCCTAAVALDEEVSYGLVYVRASRWRGEACCGSRDDGREPSRDGSLFIDAVLTAVKPPELTAVKPAAALVGVALGCRDVPFNSLLDRGLSWILACSAPFAGDWVK